MIINNYDLHWFVYFVNLTTVYNVFMCLVRLSKAERLFL